LAESLYAQRLSDSGTSADPLGTSGSASPQQKLDNEVNVYIDLADCFLQCDKAEGAVKIIREKIVPLCANEKLHPRTNRIETILNSMVAQRQFAPALQICDALDESYTGRVSDDDAWQKLRTAAQSARICRLMGNQQDCQRRLRKCYDQLIALLPPNCPLAQTTTKTVFGKLIERSDKQQAANFFLSVSMLRANPRDSNARPQLLKQLSTQAEIAGEPKLAADCLKESIDSSPTLAQSQKNWMLQHYIELLDQAAEHGQSRTNLDDAINPVRMLQIPPVQF
jgi:hypothetical protein